MNWEAIGAIGELLGAGAVLITLVYLAIQIRQNTASVATATYDSAISGYNEINLAIAQSAELADIFQRGLYDPNSLSETDGVRFAFLLRAASNQFLKILRLVEAGAFPVHEWEVYAGEMGQLYRTPGGEIFRTEHSNYADLYAAIDQLEAVRTTAFKFDQGEGAGSTV